MILCIIALGLGISLLIYTIYSSYKQKQKMENMYCFPKKSGWMTEDDI